VNVVAVNKRVAEMDMAGSGTALYLYSEICIESQVSKKREHDDLDDHIPHLVMKDLHPSHEKIAINMVNGSNYVYASYDAQFCTTC